MNDLITSSGKRINIENIPLGKGGEGSIHKVTSTNFGTNYCAKIYFERYRSDKQMKKIEFMIKNNPIELYGNFYVICWPVELLFSKKQFVGFLMPLAVDNSITLYELTTLNFNNKIATEWGKKFGRFSSEGIKARLKLCVNIAIAINYIHTTGKYTIVDFQPKNILTTISGKVSIVDCDSMQICDNNKLQFEAKVATPEYTPPEFYHNGDALIVRNLSWDYFSIAVVFYELLFGIHPFASSSYGKYEQCNTIKDKIENGLFVHGDKKSYLKAIPPYHDNFYKLPKIIQHLFFKALNEGYYQPTSRPTSEEWGRRISSVLEQNKIYNFLNNDAIQEFVDPKKQLNLNKVNSPKQTHAKPPLPGPSLVSISSVKRSPKLVKKLLFAVLYQIVARGLYHLDENHYQVRKKIYIASFNSGVIILAGAISGLDFFSSAFGFMVMSLSFFICYVIGMVDIIITSCFIKK